MLTPAERIARRVKNAARLRVWRANHPKLARALPKKGYCWRKVHPDRARAYDHKRYRTVEGRANILLQGARRRARARGMRCELTREWLTAKLTPRLCEATGMPLAWETYGPFTPTVDRRNNEQGYTLANCWIVCRRFNFTKRGKTVEAALAAWASLPSANI